MPTRPRRSQAADEPVRKKLPPINRHARDDTDGRPVKHVRKAVNRHEAPEPPRRRVKRAGAPTEAAEHAPRPTRSRHDGRHVRSFRVNEGLAPVPQLWAEVQDMWDVLLGRKPVPKEFGVLTLMEVADAFYARASEITAHIQAGERNGSIPKGSGYYKFRTGELRTFLEVCKRSHDLGSRRLTDEQLRFEQERTGRTAAG